MAGKRPTRISTHTGELAAAWRAPPAGAGFFFLSNTRLFFLGLAGSTLAGTVLGLIPGW